MQYQSVIIDHEIGQHQVAMGATPLKSVMKCFKQVVKENPEYFGPVPEEIQAQFGPDEILERIIDSIGEPLTMDAFRLADIEDMFFNSPATLRENIHEQKMLIRVDRTKDNMFAACGWIKPVMD